MKTAIKLIFLTLLLSSCATMKTQHPNMPLHDTKTASSECFEWSVEEIRCDWTGICTATFRNALGEIFTGPSEWGEIPTHPIRFCYVYDTKTNKKLLTTGPN